MRADTKQSFHCCQIQFCILKSILWLGFHPCICRFCQEIKHSIKRSHMVRDLFFLWWKTLSTSWWWYFGGEVEVCANAEQGLIRWSHNRARCQGGPDYHLLLLNTKVVRQWKSGQIKVRKYKYASRSTLIQIRKWKLKYKWSRKLPRGTRLPPAAAAIQLAWSGLV